MIFGVNFPHRDCEIIIVSESTLRVSRQRQKSLPLPPPIAKFTPGMHKRLTQLSHGAGCRNTMIGDLTLSQDKVYAKTTAS